MRIVPASDDGTLPPAPGDKNPSAATPRTSASTTGATTSTVFNVNNLLRVSCIRFLVQTTDTNYLSFLTHYALRIPVCEPCNISLLVLRTLWWQCYIRQCTIQLRANYVYYIPSRTDR